MQDWFSENDYYNDFIKALLLRDLDAMNTYIYRVTREMFSYFDTSDQYTITSNRESGFGRYDVMLEPGDIAKDDAIILEGKV